MPARIRYRVLWEYEWQPAAVGTDAITPRAADRPIRNLRLDSGYYRRDVAIDQVWS